jgi:hypothetical protein
MKMAGARWVTKFLKGHKNLSLYKTEVTHITIAVSFNKTNTDAFSDNLKDVPHSLQASVGYGTWNGCQNCAQLCTHLIMNCAP